MKEKYTEKFVGLDFSQNISLDLKMKFNPLTLQRCVIMIIWVSWWVWFQGISYLRNCRSLMEWLLIECRASEWRISWGRTLLLVIFFNRSEAITDYLSKRNPQFSYTNILAESVTATRREERKSLVISNCVKQHLLVLKSEKLSS